MQYEKGKLFLALSIPYINSLEKWSSYICCQVFVLLSIGNDNLITYVFILDVKF